MAELNARIIAKASATAGEVPSAGDLEVAELSVNTADGTIFTKHTDGSIKEISSGSGGAVDSVNGETGAVSLGIQEMDDFELSSDPLGFLPSSDTGRWATFLTSHSESGGSYTFPTSGQWRIYKSNDSNEAVFQGGNPDSDGESVAFVGALDGTPGLKATFEVDGVTYGPVNVTQALFASNSNLAVIKWDSSEFDPLTTSWGYVVDPNGPPVTTEARELNLVIGYADPAATLPLVDGDILQWDDSEQNFKPGQLPTSGGAVDSVNGETGVVSLGIQEMDDYYRPVPSPIGRWVFRGSQAPAGMCSRDGDAVWYDPSSLVQVAVVDDDGNDVSAELQALASSAGSPWVSIDGNNRELNSNFTYDAGACRLYFSSVDDIEDVLVGATEIEIYAVGDQPVPTPLPLVEGDILQWDDTEQKFKPGQLPAAPTAKNLIKINCLSATVTNSETMSTIDVFGTEQFSVGSWAPTASYVTVPETGYYLCSLAISTESTGQRATDVMSFSVNGVREIEESSDAYIRNSSGINEAGCALTTILSLTAGDQLGIMSRREGTITASGNVVAGKSSVSIAQI